MGEEEINITFGETRYANEWGKLVHLVVRKEVLPEIEKRQADPASVMEALEMKGIKWMVDYREYWQWLLEEEGIGEFNDDNEWQGESSEQIIDRMVGSARESSGEYFVQTEKLIGEMTDLVDVDDGDHVQLLIARDKNEKKLEDGGYTCLVVYPPEEKDGETVRRRELSTLNMGCQTINFAILMDDSPVLSHSKDRDFLRDVRIDDDTFVVGRFRLDNIADEELATRMRDHRDSKNIVDRGISAILGLNDARLKRKGNHIDVAMALRKVEYAKDYALATHKGVEGVVGANMIKLPDVEVL